MATRDDRDDGVRDLFAAFYPRLAGWTARLVDVETGHDIATESFTRLYERWDSVEQPRSWLFMTASNLAKDHWRRSGRERSALLRLRPVSEAAEVPDPTTRSTVRTMVEALPDSMRVPVLLHYFADLPVSEVATLTGRAEGTVKRALFDARTRMAGQLEERP